MEVASRRRSELRDRDISPERTKVWTEPMPRSAERKVPVVYYLSRNGHLEHPHFMEVTVPSGEGLYLRDVIKRLNSLRGKGIGGLYAWSSKRSYKNGFVWHDLCEGDFIYPARGNEYILKGSELPHLDSSHDNELGQVPKSVEDDSGHRKNRPAWGSFDLGEYRVCKNKMTAEGSAKNSDAWTQTEDKRQHKSRQSSRDMKEEEEGEESAVTELGRDEISPPPSSSSSETLEGLIRADGRVVPILKDGDVGNCSRRKMRSPAALMHLISCGSASVKERGFSLVSHFKGRLPRAAISGAGFKESEGAKGSVSFPAVELEEEAYFSGSLIEIKKMASDRSGELSGFRRSSSCNAERGLKMELAEKEVEGVRARCIPRRAKATASKKAPEDPTVYSSASESKSASEEPLQS